MLEDRLTIHLGEKIIVLLFLWCENAVGKFWLGFGQQKNIVRVMER